MAGRHIALRKHSQSLWLVAAAFLILLFGLPEVPLRTSNRPDAALMPAMKQQRFS